MFGSEIFEVGVCNLPSSIPSRNFARKADDRNLAASQARFSTGALPDVDLKAAQARLSYLGYAHGSVDGEMGAATEKAIRFQKANKLTETGRLDEVTAISLRREAKN